MKYQGLKFRTLQVTAGKGLKAGRVGDKSNLGAAVQLLQNVVIKLTILE
jgi:hypothetical protein